MSYELTIHYVTKYKHLKFLEGISTLKHTDLTAQGGT